MPGDPPAGAASGEPRRAEHRWPVVVALCSALALYAFLPGDLLGIQRWIVVAVGIACLVPLIVVNPLRFTRETAWSRPLSVGLTSVLVVTNQVSLVQIIVALVEGGHQGSVLLLSALQVWVANVIGFAILYWDLDRGGAVSRSMLPRHELPAADFRFPQDEDDDAVVEVAARSSALVGWTPRFIDYFYTSLSNSMAYSATDAMPLSPRFKSLMALQAFGCFVLLALVIARAVNILG
ncbi:hypothetical protein GB864_04290 [Agromyces sp. MMS17-SY077]|uniref:DUF1345 domain-containing protein n=1 Tax=Agromyces seonyuensis TaxID=2662446 RepID=A0A6I4NXD0_9MICO|nr:hypothetical protein [Agromyces seonyuensis]